MPAFYREVEFNGEYFIEMEDLLHHFNDPSIMDIKMGTRTFLEAEVKNPVLRKDLFEKMIKLDSEAPTVEERDQAAITKLRYMQFREQESSTASLGFRIEAIRMSGEPPNTNLKKVKTKEEVSYFIENFTRGHSSTIPTLHARLCDIRQKFESIPFFRSHEIIGSSLLIMYDSSNHASAWMIDFAKTIPVPDVTLNHRSPWKLENHEDGYLYGLDHLIEIFGGLADKEKKAQSQNEKNDVDSRDPS
ncbi:inositol-trisphosphate 3-kinase homolog [Aplysia californica]|uniref:Kinase n=1 Tax=Aplysia californica TaxID=6500 RepID=A0ABM1AB66_APLCA|nr:inositol-trisphosphate 3-kinase homolog [Aplysia californica]